MRTWTKTCYTFQGRGNSYNHLERNHTQASSKTQSFILTLLPLIYLITPCVHREMQKDSFTVSWFDIIGTLKTT